MKKLIALLLCALLILSLIPASALAAENEILDGRWLCADIQGNVTENTPAALKDDFGLYVNKDWILQAEIPDGETSAGSMEDVIRTLKDRQIALLKDESLTGHDAELVHKLYALVSDWDYRNAQGVEPAMPIMEAIRSIDSLEALTAYLYDRNNLLRYKRRFFMAVVGIAGCTALLVIGFGMRDAIDGVVSNQYDLASCVARNRVMIGSPLRRRNE